MGPLEGDLPRPFFLSGSGPKRRAVSDHHDHAETTPAAPPNPDSNTVFIELSLHEWKKLTSKFFFFFGKWFSSLSLLFSLSLSSSFLSPSLSLFEHKNGNQNKGNRKTRNRSRKRRVGRVFGIKSFFFALSPPPPPFLFFSLSSSVLSPSPSPSPSLPLHPPLPPRSLSQTMEQTS